MEELRLLDVRYGEGRRTFILILRLLLLIHCSDQTHEFLICVCQGVHPLEEGDLLQP